MTLHRTALALGLLLAWTTLARGGEPLASERPWERYEILVERNAFSRTRGRVDNAATAPATTPAPRPERYTVLTGVSQQGEEFVAFLEEVQGETTKVVAGGMVAGGQVKAITLDGLVFEKDGKTMEVEIGSSLSLGPGPPTSPGDGSPAVGAAAPPPPAAGPKDVPASILERLRRRREEELRKR